MNFYMLGAFLILQVFTVTLSTSSFKYYMVNVNKTNKCSEINHVGPNSLEGTVNQTKNVSQIDLSIGGENANIKNAVVVLTAYPNKLNVKVTGTMNGGSANITETCSNNSELNESINKDNVIYVQCSNYTGNNTAVSSCIDVGLVSTGKNNTFSVITLNIGCWSWVNGSQNINMSINTVNATAWAKKLSSEICSGALSSSNITPLFALLLAIFVSYMNKL